MVILVLIVFSLTSLVVTLPLTKVTVLNAANQTCYAQILSDNVCLYKTPYDLDDYSNVYFILPKTYFVVLTDISGDFYKARYQEFEGFVKKDQVQAVKGQPKKPFLTNVSFRVYSEQSRDLRTVPSTVSGASSQVSYIPLYSRNLTYYGKIVGETLVEERTNIWYYCKYTADKEYYGYVYSDFCDFMTGNIPNTEQLPFAQNPTFTDTANEAGSAKLNSKATKIIIAVLMIPALIFVFLIIKGSKLLKKEQSNSKEIKEY